MTKSGPLRSSSQFLQCLGPKKGYFLSGTFRDYLNGRKTRIPDQNVVCTLANPTDCLTKWTLQQKSPTYWPLLRTLCAAVRADWSRQSTII
jgi:hypothetical protein